MIFLSLIAAYIMLSSAFLGESLRYAEYGQPNYYDPNSFDPSGFKPINNESLKRYQL